MIYRAFPKQIEFHRSTKRIRGALAGKRGGKTECGAIEAIVHTEQQPGFNPTGVDPYLGIIVAPTERMLKTLTLKKFFAYAKPFKKQYNKSDKHLIWHNKSEILGISADKPERLEGQKANWIWIDEIFQVSEQLFLEALARVADTQGKIWCTGSLGVQYNNPKNHWAYKYFKQNPDDETDIFEWTTADNPYFPREELARLKNKLDAKTYRQMFELNWDVPGSALVYDDFDERNIVRGYQYNPALETYIVIDWGWTHQLACLFFQYDPKTDTVYLFDEIVQSKLKLDDLWVRIQAKVQFHKIVRIKKWYCDIAGNQEREQTGLSNIQWFSDNHGISFDYRTSTIVYGLPIVRSYIRNGMGQPRFFIDEVRCPKSIDGMKNYSYPEKNGIIVDENPVKKDDDAVDAIRYFFVNRLDYNDPKDSYQTFSQWSLRS
jgi:PBSX family phage terminase large subunit